MVRFIGGIHPRIGDELEIHLTNLKVTHDEVAEDISTESERVIYAQESRGAHSDSGEGKLSITIEDGSDIKVLPGASGEEDINKGAII